MALGSSAPVPSVYKVPELVKDLRFVMTRVPALWAIWIGGRLPRALREQIIVAVAQVNACRMCEHAHTRMALEAGVSDAELAALERMDESAFDRRAWLAIAHARERTRAEFAPALRGASEQGLSEALGAQTLRDVEDVARAMTVANRIANTLNALPDRWRGSPVPGSRLLDELVINLVFLPGAWLGTLVAAARQRKSPFAVWRQARGR
ncbi:MAG: carboxymuconolactone decarboxylase family protein [Deltaproteobacteria bacterium]|nr:carboxymuconolactone decarboxylase family protein [Deltaproteobacteria bacterium]NND29280.1 carboxymuconolactone decarboxylase family protein [Myxococcales bacterium]MBT8463550.1 carboxymuconolactone decarboxylase family protein [Deltaproteobacteria bacterium]MBT8480877.1 carboxymuconolactone decarboxylase family protein [Deltaproteobacteria bacterium]NNK08728.1 carboxymuconolactone decarboxylase family protein [Myxococcales bacterium]